MYETVLWGITTPLHELSMYRSKFYITKMRNSEIYDIIIAGAGAAGLTLLLHILENDVLCRKKILVVDKSLSPDNSKTWCFWDNGKLSLDGYIFHEWKSLVFSALGNSYREKLSDYHYYCVRSIDYSAKILELSSSKNNITFLEADISNFTSNGEVATIHTSSGDMNGRWIFQSVLTPPDFNEARVDISLIQHFIGWEIETEKDLFDPDTATLMDFNTSQKNGVTFFYVLPFTRTKALIEYTLFSTQLLETHIYEEALEEYIKDVFGLHKNGYRILRVEKGAIPMEDRRYNPWYCSRVMNTGTVGGYTKPSTGYTFSRLHDMSRTIVSSLEKGEEIPSLMPSGYRFRVYDMMLLYLLKNDINTSVLIFHELFRKNKFDRVLQFLDEQTTFLNELGIFSKLPYMPFFRSIYKMKHRIFTGA